MIPRPEPDASVTVVIPVYDEAGLIEAVVADVVATLGPLGWRHRILVLNDGSTDWSDALEARLGAIPQVEVRSFYPNEGKGAMLDRAFPLLDTDLAVVIDADGEYQASDIPALLEPLRTGRAEWVMGSRYGFGRVRPRQYLATYAVNRLINGWFRVLSGIAFRDLLTGLYAFRVEPVADVRLAEKRFSYSAELVWKLLRQRRLRFSEVPVGYRFRSYGQGKKIRWWETGTILLALARYRFSRSTAPREART